jgi:hypothetical protein
MRARIPLAAMADNESIVEVKPKHAVCQSAIYGNIRYLRDKRTYQVRFRGRESDIRIQPEAKLRPAIRRKRVDK